MENEELNEELQNKIDELEKRVKEMEYLLEKHKHSGKETSDISQILTERLGIKISSIMGAAESVYIDIMGVLTSVGRAATGSTIITSLPGEYFGIKWSGGLPAYFTTDAPAYFEKSINLAPQSSHTYTAGDIINWVSGATDQFRGRPGDGTWDGSFDMTAI